MRRSVRFFHAASTPCSSSTPTRRTEPLILEALKQRKKPPRARGDFLSLARVWVLFRRTLLAFWEVLVLGLGPEPEREEPQEPARFRNRR